MRIGFVTQRLGISAAAIVAAGLGGAGCGSPDPARSAPAAPAPSHPDAGAAAPAAAPAAARRGYRRALERGRAEGKSGRWAEAVRAFDAALAARPDDAVALSELGWAALHARDLARAETATLAAIARAGSPRIKAASLYTLGRIQEERGEAARAAWSYRTSLALRANRAVQIRLRAVDVDASAAPARDPAGARAPAPRLARDLPSRDLLAPARLAGPFVHVEDYCAQQTERQPDSPVTCAPRSSGAALGPSALAAAPAPLRAARLVAMTGNLGDVTCLLALETGVGSWIYDGVPCQTTSSVGRDWTAVLGLEADARGRVIARFLLSYARKEADDGADLDDGAARAPAHACEEVWVVCGVGPSGHPRCTPNLAVAWADTCAVLPPVAGDAVAMPRWDARTAPILGASSIRFPPPTLRHGAAAPEADLAAGEHVLTFP